MSSSARRVSFCGAKTIHEQVLYCFGILKESEVKTPFKVKRQLTPPVPISVFLHFHFTRILSLLLLDLLNPGQAVFSKNKSKNHSLMKWLKTSLKHSDPRRCELGLGRILPFSSDLGMFAKSAWGVLGLFPRP